MSSSDRRSKSGVDYALLLPLMAHGVLVRLDARITSQFEEPSDKLGRNVSYHFTTNLTHATSAHV